MMFMETSALRFFRPVLLVLLALLSASAGVIAASTPAGAQGVQWQPLTLDQALAEAKKSDKMVMVDVWARHCGACGTMDIDVWETAEGAKIAEGTIAIKIDSTTPEGRALSQRYPILGLPSIIFLRPDGTELDRVTGYYEKTRFYREAEPLHDGLDPMPLMEQQLKAKPDSLPLLLSAMERYLNRKREADAQAVFDRIMKLDPNDASTTAERAIGTMCRYQELIKQDYAKTAEYWKILVDRFPTSSSSGAAVDGVYRAYGALGKPDEWLGWVCPALQKNPGAMTLQRQTVYIGLRGGYRGKCLADAARRVSQDAKRNAGNPAMVKQAAWMDSVATVFEGTN
jgi:thiol-disulfide isomerase/thioredoxin